jgi:carbon starvation protein CstA
MEKAKSIIAFIDNLLGKFRRVFVNILTVLLLLLITLGIFGSLDSLFQSDEIETKDQILYLEPTGVMNSTHASLSVSDISFLV